MKKLFILSLAAFSIQNYCAEERTVRFYDAGAYAGDLELNRQRHGTKGDHETPRDEKMAMIEGIFEYEVPNPHFIVYQRIPADLKAVLDHLKVSTTALQSLDKEQLETIRHFIPLTKGRFSLNEAQGTAMAALFLRKFKKEIVAIINDALSSREPFYDELEPKWKTAIDLKRSMPFSHEAIVHHFFTTENGALLKEATTDYFEKNNYTFPHFQQATEGLEQRLQALERQRALLEKRP